MLDAKPAIPLANEAAFPTPEGVASGLTKREYFAAMALQGLCANSTVTCSAERLSDSALKHADALIAELEGGC